MNTAQLAVENLERYGEYVSIWFEDRKHTNLEQYDYTCRLAATLRERGIKSSDHVVVMMVNSPEVSAAFVAIWKIGAVIIPVTPMWNAREVRYVLEDSGAKVVLTSPELAGRVREASAEIPGFREVLIIGKSTEPAGLSIDQQIAAAERFEPLLDRAADDLAMLLYTSGTTGNPKGVMLSHDNMLFVADSIYQRNKELGQFVTMQVLPLSHIYGVLMMNIGSLLGTRGRILKHFDAKQVLASIEELKVQRLSVVPTMLTLLINHPEREKYDVSSLEHVGSGGAPLSEATRLEFERLFNCRVVQGYGLSETAGALTGYHPDEPYRVGSVGPALPGIEMCVMDFDNRILSPGEVGEICSRGRHIMKGYLNKAEATQATIIDGWLHTGDIGYIDADGYVFITDRKKDLIIKGAENISPREIEEGLYAHQAIAEAAVFGIPDETYGEEIVAAVVIRAGQTTTEEELKHYLAGYVTKFKVPSKIAFLDALPKGSTGKILKRALRDQFKR